MSFCISLIVIAVALFDVGVGETYKQLPGGWYGIDPENVPSDVVSEVEEQVIAQANSVHGIRLAEIQSALSQVVSGANYKMMIVFHDTSCPVSASNSDIHDESTCARIAAFICSVSVYHQPWTQTIQVSEADCYPHHGS